MPSQGGSTRDNLDQLHGNAGLTSLVVHEGQLFHDLTSVLAGVLHSIHTSGLLRGGIVEEGDPEVAGNVQLVESKVASVLVGKLHVVSLAELESIQETLAGENLELANVGGDGRHVLVVEDGDFIVAFTGTHDVLTEGHDGGVVVRSVDLGNTDLEEVRHGALHAIRALLAERENLLLGATSLINVIAHVPDDTRVDSTAHTLVRGEGNDELARVRRSLRGTLLHVSISSEHHVHAVEAELFTSVEANKILLHLGGCHHLHSLGDLTNVVNGLHSLLELLLRSGEVALLSGHDQLGGSKGVPIEEWISAHALELRLHNG